MIVRQNPPILTGKRVLRHARSAQTMFSEHAFGPPAKQPQGVHVALEVSQA